MMRVFFLVYRSHAWTVVLVGLLFLFSWDFFGKELKVLKKRIVKSYYLNKVYELTLSLLQRRRENFLQGFGIVESTGCGLGFSSD